MQQIARLREELELQRLTLETEHRALVESQAQLEASRDWYASLFDFAPIGFATLTPNGVITGINVAGAKLLGWIKLHLRGTPLIPLVVKHERQRYSRFLAEVCHSKRAVRAEFAFIRQERETIQLELTGILIQVFGAQSGRINLALRDVTEQKRAEEALRQAHAEMEQRVLERTAELTETLDRVNDLYHNAPCGYHSLDSHGVFIEINDTALKLLGYKRHELVGKMTVFDLQAPDKRKPKQDAFERLQNKGTIENLELEFIRKDGSFLPVLLSATSVRDANGKFLRTRSTFIDLTARRLAERALRQSEARLQAILDNSPEMIFLKDLKGRYLHSNRQFEQTYHLARGEAVGMTDFDVLPENDAKLLQAHDRQVIESGQALQFEESSEHDDGPHVSLVSKFPIHDPDGKVYAVGGIVTDVTERRRLETEVLRVIEHEQQRIAQDLHDGLGQQLAGTWFLSDTLRKNLAAQSSPEEPTAAKIVDLLETAVGQTRSLARGLYPVRQQVDGLMAGLEELAANLSGLFNVNCRFICPEPVPVPDYKVATHLYRIVQEAASNAIKHGKAQEIQIKLFATEMQYILHVTDDGIGVKTIPKKHNGMGLRTMRYRAELLGADFAIRRTGTRGTEVVCSVRKS